VTAPKKHNSQIARDSLIKLLDGLAPGDAFLNLPEDERRAESDLQADLIIKFADVGALKERRDAGAVKAQEAVVQFTNLVKRLIRCIDEMPPNAVRSIASETRADDLLVALALAKETSRPSWEPHPYILRIALNNLLPGAIKASEKRVARSKGGAPVKQLPREVAEIAAKAYERITGKEATPARNFVTDKPLGFEKFLEEVYCVLGVQVSAEDQAKLLRRREKTHQK